jgi:hypothetical protein
MPCGPFQGSHPNAKVEYVDSHGVVVATCDFYHPGLDPASSITEDSAALILPSAAGPPCSLADEPPPLGLTTRPSSLRGRRIPAPPAPIWGPHPRCRRPRSDHHSPDPAVLHQGPPIAASRRALLGSPCLRSFVWVPSSGRTCSSSCRKPIARNRFPPGGDVPGSPRITASPAGFRRGPSMRSSVWVPSRGFPRVCLFASTHPVRLIEAISKSMPIGLHWRYCLWFRIAQCPSTGGQPLLL